MQSLREQPIVSLADAGNSDTFIADVFQPRPPFDEIENFQVWAGEAAEKIQEAMKRKNCAVTWVQLVIDHVGFMTILRFTHPLILGDAKTATTAIFKCVPAPFTDEQRRAVQQSLRPLDEVDRNRLAAWQTVASLRPAGKK